jgi:tRNA/tmRNA/rRNA uracil-C5-methylase (TrmA/RlmC/RlmD family)
MKKPIPNITITQLQILKRTGELGRIYEWILNRVQEFQIQLDSEGDFGYDGEIMTKNKLTTMLKRDLRNAIEQGTFVQLPNAIIDHVVKHALKTMAAEAMKHMSVVDA